MVVILLDRFGCMSLNIFKIFAAGDQEPSSTQEVSFTYKASSASCPAVPAASSTSWCRCMPLLLFAVQTFHCDSMW